MAYLGHCVVWHSMIKALLFLYLSDKNILQKLFVFRYLYTLHTPCRPYSTLNISVEINFRYTFSELEFWNIGMYLCTYRFSFQIHRHVILSTNTLSSSPFSAGDKNTDDKKSIVKAFAIILLQGDPHGYFQK